MTHTALVLGLVLAGLAAAQQPAPATRQLQTTEELLLTFRDGITNWAEVMESRQWKGWKSCVEDPEGCLPACAWGGVSCDPYHVHEGNHVTDLNLGCSPCTVKMKGRLRSGLQRLPHLTILHLSNNELEGPLPPEWGEPGSFPELLELNLNENQLTGNMPDTWAVGPAFVNLADLQMASNRFSGTFPAGFAVTNTSFISVMSFSFANNNFSGTLPNYINGMITMSVVNVHNNRFTGTLPPDWGTQGYIWNSTLNNTQALEYLTLHGNQLTGTLPDAWAQPGSFEVLKMLTLSDNPLGGTLPEAWGATTDALQALESLNVSHAGLVGPLPAWGVGMQKLAKLTLAGNNLTGTIPASWMQLPALIEVVLQPGNPDACTSVPSGATFQVCRDGDALCLPIAADPNACAAAPSDDGSSFPVAAVAVPVAVVACAAVVVAGYMWYRHRCKAVQPTAVYKDQESGLYYDAQGKPLPGQGPEGGGGGATGTLGVPASSAAKGVAQHSSASSWFPWFRSHSAELEATNSCSTPSVAAQSAPLWLPGHLLSDPSTASLPLPPSGSSAAQAGSPSRGSEQLGGGSLYSEHPCFTSKELAALQLSDWEIRPEEIAILKRPDDSDWQLGSGGFGTVYKAMRNGVQPVAVKVLGSTNGMPLKAMTDSDFAQEINILRACRDTNILQFQGACFKDGRTLLVTEYMEGGNLTHNIRARRITWWRRGKKVALDVARGLVYLHSRRIIHLDIKSANVLLTREGTAKVGDVGMAKIMAGDYVSGVVGTLAWSAPELLMGQRCSSKADVYSLGVVLWEIATGELPVRGQLRDPNVPEECPQELLDFIYRCIDPDPAKRPTSTEAVELLLQVPGALPSVAPPPTKEEIEAEAAEAAAATRRRGRRPRVPGACRSASTGAPSGATAAASPFLVARERQLAERQEQHEEQPLDEQQGASPPPSSQEVQPARSVSVRPPRAGTPSLQAVLEDKMIEEAMAEMQGGPNTASYSASRVYSEGSCRLTPAISGTGSDGPNSVQRRLVLGKSAFASPFSQVQRSTSGSLFPTPPKSGGST